MQIRLNRKFLVHFKELRYQFWFIVFVIPTLAFSEMCVLNNPENAMKRIFSKAENYTKIVNKVNSEKQNRIEKRLEMNLHHSEKDEWVYYKLESKKGRFLGYITAVAEKYNNISIEMVIGITPDGDIKNVYMQNRAADKNQAVSDKLLKSFAGTTILDFKKTKFKKGPDNAPIRNVLLTGIKKSLILYDEIGKPITSLKQILASPASFDFKEVTLEGTFNGICCNIDFYYKEGEEVIEIKGQPPVGTKKGDSVRIDAKVRVCITGKDPIITVKNIEKR